MSNDREQKGKHSLAVLLAAVLCAVLLCAWFLEPENRLQQAEASAGGSGNRTVLLGGMCSWEGCLSGSIWRLTELWS